MNKENVIVFGDSVGRLFIGEKIKETDTAVEVKAPQVVETEMNQQNQVGIKFIPMAYLELLEDATDGSWTFPKSAFSFNDLKASEQAVGLYERVVESYQAMTLKMKDGDDQEEVPDNVVELKD
jgi:hypothetical protein